MADKWENNDWLKYESTPEYPLRLFRIRLHQEYLNWKDISESICKGNDYIRGYRDGVCKALQMVESEIEEYEYTHR